MLCLLQSCAAGKHPKKHTSYVENEMTVAAIRPPAKDETFVTIVFLQSARFYRIPKDADPKYMELLQSSAKNKVPVTIKRASEASDIIVGVH